MLAPENRGVWVGIAVVVGFLLFAPITRRIVDADSPGADLVTGVWFAWLGLICGMCVYGFSRLFEPKPVDPLPLSVLKAATDRGLRPVVDQNGFPHWIIADPEVPSLPSAPRNSKEDQR